MKRVSNELLQSLGRYPILCAVALVGLALAIASVVIPESTDGPFGSGMYVGCLLTAGSLIVIEATERGWAAEIGWGWLKLRADAGDLGSLPAIVVPDLDIQRFATALVGDKHVAREILETAFATTNDQRNRVPGNRVPALKIRAVINVALASNMRAFLGHKKLKSGLAAEFDHGVLRDLEQSHRIEALLALSLGLSAGEIAAICDRDAVEVAKGLDAVNNLIAREARPSG